MMKRGMTSLTKSRKNRRSMGMKLMMAKTGLGIRSLTTEMSRGTKDLFKSLLRNNSSLSQLCLSIGRICLILLRMTCLRYIKNQLLNSLIRIFQEFTLVNWSQSLMKKERTKAKLKRKSLLKQIRIPSLQSQLSGLTVALESTQ
jgi:hypothetical protein